MSKKHKWTPLKRGGVMVTIPIGYYYLFQVKETGEVLIGRITRTINKKYYVFVEKRHGRAVMGTPRYLSIADMRDGEYLVKLTKPRRNFSDAIRDFGGKLKAGKKPKAIEPPPPKTRWDTIMLPSGFDI